MSVDRVRFGGGFGERDRALIGDTWSQALGRFDQLDRSWGMELSVKDREPPGQVVTLEAQAPGKNKLVAPRPRQTCGLRSTTWVMTCATCSPRRAITHAQAQSRHEGHHPQPLTSRHRHTSIDTNHWPCRHRYCVAAGPSCAPQSWA